MKPTTCISLLSYALALVFPFAVKAEEADRPPVSFGSPISAGDVRNKVGIYTLVFYYYPAPKVSTQETARKLLGQRLPGIPFQESIKALPSSQVILFEEEKAPLVNMRVPDAGYFKHFGRGMTPELIEGIQKTKLATRITLIVPKSSLWKSEFEFTRFARDFANATGAAIWDEATRECFSVNAWDAARIATWPAPDSIPDLRRHITIHLYRPDSDGASLRAITLGMSKFALPDVVIERLSVSDNRPAGNLINLVCRALSENPVVNAPENQLIRVADIRDKAVRESFRSNLKQGASESVKIALLAAKSQDGDPDNRIIAIDFRNNVGSTEDERREAALSSLWGAEDSIVKVKHDENINAASGRARAQLPRLRGLFIAGLRSDERIMLKAPFARDDSGQEWMWVEVRKWGADGTIEGLLQNDPFYIKSLRAGASVSVKQADIFDYIHCKADGTMEGNETGRLIQQQGLVESKK